MKPSRTAFRIMRDRLLPDRPVRRSIRGIEMSMPRRHVLPYMALPGSAYAQNLVELAAGLAKTTDDLVVLDVGANIGDSALLVRDEVDCRIVCVEGDPQWLTFLEQNVGNILGVVVEAVLLSSDGAREYVSIVHESVGTSRVAPATETSGIATLPLEELLERRPELARVRLVKSDTDGFDVKLATGYARVFSESRPVIFFEYDPRPTRLVTPELTPENVWGELADLGYSRAVVWTNGGHVLGACPTADLEARGRDLDGDLDELGYQFWDVAVAHHDDADGLAVLASLARNERWVSPARWKPLTT